MSMYVPSDADACEVVSTAAGAAFLRILDRIEATLDAETWAIRTHQPIDFAEIDERKRQGLVDLSRFAPDITPEVLDEATRARLARLSEKLAGNRRVLDTQLRAVRKVSGVFAEATRRKR